jgi:hypothetical protein
VLTNRMTELVAQMQWAADDLIVTERDCFAISPNSTEAQLNQVVIDVAQVAHDINSPPP